MQMSIFEVFIYRRLHMNTSMILICIWLICRLCTTLHTKCCGAVLDARIRANKSRALTNAHVSASNQFGCYAGSHVLQKKICLSVEKPINGCYKRSKCTSPIFQCLFIYSSFFFSGASVSKVCVRCRCDGAFVSMTFISNKASTWGVQAPRMPRSAVHLLTCR